MVSPNGGMVPPVQGGQPELRDNKIYTVIESQTRGGEEIAEVTVWGSVGGKGRPRGFILSVKCYKMTADGKRVLTAAGSVIFLETTVGSNKYAALKGPKDPTSKCPGFQPMYVEILEGKIVWNGEVATGGELRLKEGQVRSSGPGGGGMVTPVEGGIR